MFLLITRNYKPDFEMMVEGIFSTREQAREFEQELQSWNYDNGIYAQEYYTIEMPVDPSPTQNEHIYCTTSRGIDNFVTEPVSYYSDQWLQDENKLDEVIKFCNDDRRVYTRTRNANDAAMKGSLLIKQQMWGEQ